MANLSQSHVLKEVNRNAGFNGYQGELPHGQELGSGCVGTVQKRGKYVTVLQTLGHTISARTLETLDKFYGNRNISILSRSQAAFDNYQCIPSVFLTVTNR
jgi:hypothetical protein